MPSLTQSAWLVWITTLPVVIQFPTTPVDRPQTAVIQRAGAQQSGTPAKNPGREIFFSWGYNGDTYGKNDIHFDQPSLGNQFTYVAVRARDSKGWTDLFDHSLFVPQYNIRLGLFLNEKWGVELAHDHMKWIVKQDQQVRMTGTLNGAPVDTQVTLSEDVLKYQLNNGANPFFINLIRRFKLAGEPGRTGYLAFLAKAGAGFANPHTENTVFGVPNEKGFQFFQGWNVDVAAAVRLHLWRPLYFEFEDKLLYARYYGINIDQGKAQQGLKANEFIWSFGWAFR